MEMLQNLSDWNFIDLAYDSSMSKYNYENIKYFLSTRHLMENFKPLYNSGINAAELRTKFPRSRWPCR
jgi:hypothetical protein